MSKTNKRRMTPQEWCALTFEAIAFAIPSREKFAGDTEKVRQMLPLLQAVLACDDKKLEAVTREAPAAHFELLMMRWGMPCPPAFGTAAITNIRNTASPHWRRWLGPANRCLIPVTSFCEYEDTKPRKTPTWFALDGNRPLFCFAGIWTPWSGTRGTKMAPAITCFMVF